MNPLEKVQGSLLGVAIGDALGMPVETWKSDRIRSLNGGRGVMGFINPLQTRVSDTHGLHAGDTTDDTQLTVVVAESLIRTSGFFDKIDCAKGHVEALRTSPFGWGKTTQDAIQDIADGKRDPNRDRLPPAEPGRGLGNGVIMKIAPIALAHSLTSYDLWQSCVGLGRLTHPDIRASIAAYVVARLIRDEFDTNPPSTTSEYLDRLSEIKDEVLTIEASYEMTGLRISEVLNSTKMRIRDENLPKNDPSFDALGTLEYVLENVTWYQRDFRAGVLAAVNAGGDTDTNASIVGGILGARVGSSGIPYEWISFRPEFERMIDLGSRLYQACQAV